jgi:hypothetical protein
MDCLGTQLRYLKACTALSVSQRTPLGERSHYLRAARHEARRIGRSALAMASPMAQAIESGIAGVEGRRDVQVTALRACADGFDRAEMALHRESARWHLGTLVAHEAEARTTAGAWMQRQGILRHDLMARALVPQA